VVWECPGNVSFTLANGDEKATAAAFAKAAHVSHRNAGLMSISLS
jgi:hypothetical protein